MDTKNGPLATSLIIYTTPSTSELSQGEPTFLAQLPGLSAAEAELVGEGDR